MLNTREFGPLLKTSAFLYISYLTVKKVINIPLIFFILYGLGSLLYLLHLIFIEHTLRNIISIKAEIYECYVNIFVSSVVFTIFFINN